MFATDENNLDHINNQIKMKGDEVEKGIVALSDVEYKTDKTDDSHKFDHYEELGEYYKSLDDEGRFLEIKGLRKEFGNFTAVNDVSVKM